MLSDESDYNRAADMHRAPLHTPQQMAALLLDLYTFLTTLLILRRLRWTAGRT